MAICPICGAESKPRSENPAFPFCNARCKTVDLGKWLNEDYRIAEDDSSEDDESDREVQDEIVRH
jgi:endogenous inhibitor of DNA gyrase (YacG/DUF329 family)